MKKKQQKITTIEDLATLMQGEFLTIRERFDEMDKKFTDLRTELREEIGELRIVVNRIDTRTQNQVDVVYEEVTELKEDVKLVKHDIVAMKLHLSLT